MEFTAIKEIRSGMKNINCMFIVLEVTAATKTKENREVFSFKVADSSAWFVHENSMHYDSKLKVK